MKMKNLFFAALVAAAASSGNSNHTVVKDDTLWDLSGKYLGNPFLWPKIWEVNKHVENPHRIYPGDSILIPDLENGNGNGSAGNGTAVNAQELSNQLSNYYMNRSELYSISTLKSAPYIEPVDDNARLIGKSKTNPASSSFFLRT